MFIDTLEFTIPIDLCSLYATLQQEARSQLEFPASVNSYGTTQDANVQVALRANKVTFKVDGVSSNASIISKSECRTLKLSVFDVDRTLMQKNVEFNNSNNVQVHHSPPVSNPAKRLHEQSVSLPPAKSSRTSYSESPRPRSPAHRRSQPLPPSPRSTENSHSRTHSDTPVNVKQEPEDPDLIEIEPDPEPDDVIPKKEAPYMQIDYSSDVPHTQTSQAALDRLSFPPTSRSHSSSSSFHQNVPHVPDYSEPGPSQSHHGDQSADDFLVFQDDNEYGEENEETEYSNDGPHHARHAVPQTKQIVSQKVDIIQMDHSYLSAEPAKEMYIESESTNVQVLVAVETKVQIGESISTSVDTASSSAEDPADGKEGDMSIFGSYPCPHCDKVFNNAGRRWHHKTAVHDKVTFLCGCGSSFRYSYSLRRHQKNCPASGPQTS